MTTPLVQAREALHRAADDLAESVVLSAKAGETLTISDVRCLISRSGRLLNALSTVYLLAPKPSNEKEHHMTRLATLAAVLLVTGCAFLIPIKGSPDSYALSRRVAKEQAARELAAQESKLSDCRIDHPLDTKRSPCALVAMRCTQGAGTRKEAKDVPVFATGPDCFPKDAGVCQ